MRQKGPYWPPPVFLPFRFTVYLQLVKPVSIFARALVTEFSFSFAKSAYLLAKVNA